VEPFCSAFYGAHFFRYWLVSTRSTGKGTGISEILLASAADSVKVVDSSGGKNFEVLQTNCTALSCETATLRYHDHEFRAERCTRQHFVDGKASTEEVIKC
jgi:hypothetical protein